MFSLMLHRQSESWMKFYQMLWFIQIIPNTNSHLRVLNNLLVCSMSSNDFSSHGISIVKFNVFVVIMEKWNWSYHRCMRGHPRKTHREGYPAVVHHWASESSLPGTKLCLWLFHCSTKQSIKHTCEKNKMNQRFAWILMSVFYMK